MASPWAPADPSAPTRYRVVPSPVGDLLLTAADGALSRVLFTPFEIRPEWLCDDGSLDDAATQLADYFAGRRADFALPLAPAGSAFQLAVWAELTRIPFGQTRTYGELAAALGRPTASRAVGAANGRNPLAVVVPCHRVIGTGGRLTGYAGGLERKRLLLDLESMSPPLLSV